MSLNEEEMRDNRAALQVIRLVKETCNFEFSAPLDSLMSYNAARCENLGAPASGFSVAAPCYSFEGR